MSTPVFLKRFLSTQVDDFIVSSCISLDISFTFLISEIVEITNYRWEARGNVVSSLPLYGYKSAGDYTGPALITVFGETKSLSSL